ncbi:Similar to Uncharacterized transcriptional regulatory protein C11D3.07c; acc. no. Q10086 [Pyronema omphalodes CBS 100304]|uniref:Similar to Uncharacterized transcriptional regulatory protein C11D3.07c acc. no. Q10086 n=1 Tax=Pyronema omphalodes (strain CBS 100304) TaxID=1076935 RepID=U4KY28_PYROM|nr:Similar to Uncharacterized transcriptional regulatory protein C11D3.07c; acc. no. Q10086 [Pyronema omphalodes CBS 100304]
MDGVNRSSEKLASAIPSYGHTLFRKNAAMVKSCIPDKVDAMELIEESYKFAYTWFPIFDKTSLLSDIENYHTFHSPSKDKPFTICINTILIFGLYSKLLNSPPSLRPSLSLYSRQRTETYFFAAWSALDDLEVDTTPKLRNVQALFTMSMYAIELSRPALCWGLLSQAARLAQALGLHRRTKPDHHQGGRGGGGAKLTEGQIEERKLLFWCIYILDKQVSLIFGRSACLPELIVMLNYPLARQGWGCILGIGWLLLDWRRYSRRYILSCIQRRHLCKIWGNGRWR